MKMELLRVRFDEQLRSEKRRAAGTAIESQVVGTLKPWREVVAPHKDVASGKYQQAEFAAESLGYTATKHQHEVGTGYFDAVAQVIAAGESSTTALHGSTEQEQFH